MAKIRPHLGRPPITEGLIDIQVRPKKDTGLDALKKLSTSIQGYQLQTPVMTLRTTWKVSEEHGAQDASESFQVGVRLQSSGEPYVLQLRTDGFTISRLEPYESWESLVLEARKLWDIYRTAIEPTVITRVATRFINLLKLPMRQNEEFGEYLTKSPEVPPELQQGVLEFMQRVVIPKSGIDARATVIQLLQGGLIPADYVPVILDIDVYKEVELRPQTDDAWKLLSELRVFKNELFFAHLTERTVEMFQ